MLTEHGRICLFISLIPICIPRRTFRYRLVFGVVVHGFAYLLLLFEAICWVQTGEKNDWRFVVHTDTPEETNLSFFLLHSETGEDGVSFS